MEPKNQTIPISRAVKAVFILAVLLTGVSDIITTIIAQEAHPHVKNECSPLYLLIPSMPLLFVTKTGLLIILCLILLRNYNRTAIVLVRYLIVYGTAIIILLQLSASINNHKVSRIPSNQIRQASPEERQEAYVQFVTGQKLIQEYDQPTPLLGQIFLINLLQFAVWRCFENCRNATLS